MGGTGGGSVHFSSVLDLTNFAFRTFCSCNLDVLVAAFGAKLALPSVLKEQAKRVPLLRLVLAQLFGFCFGQHVRSAQMAKLALVSKLAGAILIKLVAWEQTI